MTAGLAVPPTAVSRHLKADMRILHVITGLGTGGAEVMLARLCPALSSRGVENRVVALRGNGPVAAQLRASGIEVEALNVRSLPTVIAAWRRLRAIVKEYRPAVIHAWLYHGGLAGRSVVWGRRRPALILGVHHTPLGGSRDKLATRFVVRLLALLSAKFDAICYVSKKSAAVHESMGYERDRTRLMPNGFDTDSFSPNIEERRRIRAELGISEDAVVIGQVARWHPVKDHGTFLRAASLFLNREPGAVFVLVGDGIDANNAMLQQQASSLGIASSLRLCGPRNDMPAINAALDIASSSSSGEAFPLSLGEAMSCAVPCVATDVGDVRDIIAGTGVVVPPRDPEALCAGWLTVARMEPKARHALGGRARERIATRYSLGAAANSYAALYNEVAKNICRA